MNRIEQLAAEIERHNKIYFEEKSFEITDPEYDLLVEELKALAPDHVLVTKITEPAGSVVHPTPLLSLNKTYTSEGLLAWAEGVARGPAEVYTCANKFDGSAVRIGKDNAGLPIYLYSRGDGLSGEDWSRNMFVIKFPHGFAERGEVVVTKADFALHGADYKNSRAMAAGVLNNKNLPADFPACLTFVPYTHGAESFTMEDMPQIDFIATMQADQGGEIPIDGLVIRLADEEYFASLGNTDHHPLGAIALKIANPSTIAKVIDVIFQCGKRNLTPVAILEPVELDGVTIERVTLHNHGNLMSLQPIVGATVRLERAGSVIPYIAGVNKPGKTSAETPTECPACASPTAIVDDIHLRCTNPACGGQAAKRLRDAMIRVDIEDCGPKTCSNLVAAGVRDLVGLFKFWPEQWSKLPGFAAASGGKMYAQVQDILGRALPDWKLLAALNIPGIGTSMAKKLCDRWTLEELRLVDLQALDGIGPNRAAEIKEALESTEWLDMLTTFRHTSTKGSLSSPVIVFTGAGPHPRGELERLAKERGYLMGKAVTKSTALLICADPNSGSSKLKKAQAYGTKIRSYEEWLGEQV